MTNSGHLKRVKKADRIAAEVSAMTVKRRLTLAKKGVRAAIAAPDS